MERTVYIFFLVSLLSLFGCTGKPNVIPSADPIKPIEADWLRQFGLDTGKYFKSYLDGIYMTETDAIIIYYPPPHIPPENRTNSISYSVRGDRNGIASQLRLMLAIQEDSKLQQAKQHFLPIAKTLYERANRTDLPPIIEKAIRQEKFIYQNLLTNELTQTWLDAPIGAPHDKLYNPLLLDAPVEAPYVKFHSHSLDDHWWLTPNEWSVHLIRKPGWNPELTEYIWRDPFLIEMIFTRNP